MYSFVARKSECFVRDDAKPQFISHTEIEPEILEQQLNKKNCPVATFKGYASIFNKVDLQNDLILPGAFKSCYDHVKDIKLLWQHQLSCPIGFIDSLEEDEVGLYVTGKILLSISKGAELYELLKHGVVDGLSIGYETLSYYNNPAEGIRYIKDLILWEISFVTLPANRDARILMVGGSGLEPPTSTMST